MLRSCRQQLGITQEELAWRASMHRTYIADIERGARNVSLRSVANLAKALEVTLGELLAQTTEAEGTVVNAAKLSLPPTREILLIQNSAEDIVLAQRAFKKSKIANPLRLVKSAEEALDYLSGVGKYENRKSVRPELILLDLNLPKMSGVEFLRRIKTDGAFRALPVVVLTVSGADRMVAECGRLGVENYLVKPISSENLFRITPKLNLHLTLGPESEVGDASV